MRKTNKILAGIVTFMAIAVTGCGDSGAQNEQDKANETSTTAFVQETTVDDSTNTTENTTNPAEPDTTTQAPVYEDFMGYKIEKIDADMRVEEGINVRSGPDTSFERLGGLMAGQIISVTGKCLETGWYRIAYENQTGFVIGDYLVSEASEEVTGGLILGDECPYVMLVKTTYKGQEGWFYRSAGEPKPENHEEIVKEIMDTDGYTVVHEPIYVGGWRDVGDVMWIGYSKP